jgi:hypothetical protein
MQQAWEREYQAVRELATRDLTPEELKKAAEPAKKKAVAKKKNRE